MIYQSDRLLRVAGVMAALAFVPAGVTAQQQTRSAPSDTVVPACPQVGYGGMMGYGMMGRGMTGPGTMYPGMMGPAMMYGGMMGPWTMTQGSGVMMQAMWFQPSWILTRRTQLELTPAQISQITEIAQRERREVRDARADMQAGASALARSFDEDHPDTAAVRDAAGRVLRPREGMLASLIADAALVRGILTPQQRETVQSMPNGMYWQRGWGQGSRSDSSASPAHGGSTHR